MARAGTFAPCPAIATLAGIALYSAMEAAMKEGTLAIRACSAYFLHGLIGFGLTARAWWMCSRCLALAEAIAIRVQE